MMKRIFCNGAHSWDTLFPSRPSSIARESSPLGVYYSENLGENMLQMPPLPKWTSWTQSMNIMHIKSKV